MITDEDLPEGWSAGTERTVHDEQMDRTYETRRYDRADGDAAVRIVEVQAPKDFGGWGFSVTLDRDVGSEGLERGPFETLDAAREAAIEAMSEYAGDSGDG